MVLSILILIWRSITTILVLFNNYELMVALYVRWLVIRLFDYSHVWFTVLLFDSANIFASRFISIIARAAHFLPALYDDDFVVTARHGIHHDLASSSPFHLAIEMMKPCLHLHILHLLLLIINDDQSFLR